MNTAKTTARIPTDLASTYQIPIIMKTTTFDKINTPEPNAIQLNIIVRMRFQLYVAGSSVSVIIIRAGFNSVGLCL